MAGGLLSRHSPDRAPAGQRLSGGRFALPGLIFAVLQEGAKLAVDDGIRLAQPLLQRSPWPMSDPSAIRISNVVEKRVAVGALLPLHKKDRERHRLLIVGVDAVLAIKRGLVEFDEFRQWDGPRLVRHQADRLFHPAADQPADLDRTVRLSETVSK